MTIGFALLLNNECHNFIRQMQLEIHQTTGIALPRQTPHITIKSPFEVDEVKHFVQYVEDLALNTKPIPIDFKGFGSFDDKVIFLDVMQNQKLLNLHWKILSNLKDKFGVEPHELEGENVKFHASIAGFAHHQTFLQVHDHLSQYQPRFSFTAKEMGIFLHIGEGQGWIVNRRVHFGNG
ncbi:MAG: 2'-5' RNA ligase family protein [Bacteroidota bacterium]